MPGCWREGLKPSRGPSIGCRQGNRRLASLSRGDGERRRAARAAGGMISASERIKFQTPLPESGKPQRHATDTVISPMDLVFIPLPQWSPTEPDGQPNLGLCMARAHGLRWGCQLSPPFFYQPPCWGPRPIFFFFFFWKIKFPIFRVQNKPSFPGALFSLS